MTVHWHADTPDNWDSVPLRYLAEVKTGGTPDRSNSNYWNGQIPWVSSKDMKSAWIEGSEEYVTEAALKQSSTKLIPENSLLLVARSGILDHTIPVAVNRCPVAINQDLRGYIPRSNVDPRYLREFINSHEDQLLKIWRKQGATVQSLDSAVMAETDSRFLPSKYRMN